MKFLITAYFGNEETHELSTQSGSLVVEATNRQEAVLKSMQMLLENPEMVAIDDCQALCRIDVESADSKDGYQEGVYGPIYVNEPAKRVGHMDGVFANPKFKVGDTFTVHFNYYEKGELTYHTITRVDTSGEEWDGVVYWDDIASVFVTEEQLLKDRVILGIVDECRNNIMCPACGSSNINGESRFFAPHKTIGVFTQLGQIDTKDINMSLPCECDDCGAKWDDIDLILNRHNSLAEEA